MKVEVIGKKDSGCVLNGCIGIGQEIVIKRKGKVERVIIVRGRRYTKTSVSFDKVGVMLKNGAVKKVISKGVKVDGKRRI